MVLSIVASATPVAKAQAQSAQTKLPIVRQAAVFGAAAAASLVVALPSMAAYTVPELPYAYEALEPSIDTETMHLHHDKHHAAYVGKLNGAVDSAPSLGSKSLLELVQGVGTSAIPAEVNGVVRNHGGGHWNHAFFWSIMRPHSQESKMSSELESAIKSTFGSVDAMKTAFNDKALGQFGSGWAWLIVKPDGSLAVTSTPNQDNPLMKEIVAEAGIPIAGNDTWEHASYLKYQNRKAEYFTAWWDVVNWEQVSENYAAAKEGKVLGPE